MEKSKEEALRQAKIRYLDQADELSSDPFLWSSFVLVGDQRPLQVSYRFMWIMIALFIALSAAYVIRKKVYLRKTAPLLQ